MEDLQDALEDAQYFSAMSSKDNKGKKIEPRVNYPSELALAEWMEKNQDDPSLFTIPNICLDSLGFFLFLKFCCENGDQASALFVEAVAKYKVIAAAKIRHKFFDNILREFIDQTLEPRGNIEAPKELEQTQGDSFRRRSRSGSSSQGGVSESNTISSLNHQGSFKTIKKGAISERTFEFSDERLCRQWNQCYLSANLEALGRKHVFEGQWPKPHPCAKPRKGRINTKQAAASAKAANLLNMRQVNGNSQLQRVGSARHSSPSAGGNTPRAAPPPQLYTSTVGVGGGGGGVSSNGSVGSISTVKSNDSTPSKRWRPWSQHSVVAPEHHNQNPSQLIVANNQSPAQSQLPNKQVVDGISQPATSPDTPLTVKSRSGDSGGLDGGAGSNDLKNQGCASAHLVSDETSDHMAALNHILINEGRKEHMSNGDTDNTSAKDNFSDEYPNIDPYLSNILPIQNAELLLHSPLNPRNSKNNSSDSPGAGSVDDKSPRTSSSVESVFRDGEREGVLWSLSSFDLIESIVFDRLCRKHGPHFLKLPAAYFNAQRELNNANQAVGSSNATSSSGSKKSTSSGRNRSMSSDKIPTRKRTNSSNEQAPPANLSSSSDTQTATLSNESTLQPLSIKGRNSEEKKESESSPQPHPLRDSTTRSSTVSSSSQELPTDSSSSPSTTVVNTTNPNMNALSLPASANSPSSNQEQATASVSSGFSKRKSVSILETCSNTDPLMFKNGESNAYYKWLQFQMIKSTEVSGSDFTQFRILGRGGFGLVYGCMHNSTGTMYAMKTMDRRRVKMKRALDLCWNERIILGQLDSPFIVSLSYAFYNKNELYLVMDLMLGGDMGFWLHKKKRLSHEETVYHAARIFLALKHMHKHHIVYRDLKPQNILLDEIGRTRISDLGLACLIGPNMRGSCGTRGYMAPEMLMRDSNGQASTYTESVDWFSFGCVLYELRMGQSPFRTSAAGKFAAQWMKTHKLSPKSNSSQVSPGGGGGGGLQPKNKIDIAVTEMEVAFAPNEIKELGFDYVDLCQALLTKNPAERLGKRSDDIIMHPWFQKYVNMEGISNDSVPPPFTPGKDIHAQSQSVIGTFDEDMTKIPINDEDDRVLASWTYSSNSAFNREIISGLKSEKSKNMNGPKQGDNNACCLIS